jgi:hypothetical protein
MTIEADAVGLLIIAGGCISIEGIRKEGKRKGATVADTRVIAMLVMTMTAVTRVIERAVVSFDSLGIVPMSRTPVGPGLGREIK